LTVESLDWLVASFTLAHGEEDVRTSSAVLRAPALGSALVVACCLVLTAPVVAGTNLPDAAGVTVLTDTPSEIVVRCTPPAGLGDIVGADDASRIVFVRVPDRGRISAR
jgi:hypothetical protein